MRVAACAAFVLAGASLAGCQAQRVDTITTGSIASAAPDHQVSGQRAGAGTAFVGDAAPRSAQAFVTYADAEPASVVSPAAYAGTWRIDDGQSARPCSVELGSQLRDGAFAAWTRLCSSDELFGVQRWQSREGGLALLDLGGDVRATLSRVGPDRFEGALASDGTPISMWR